MGQNSTSIDNCRATTHRQFLHKLIDWPTAACNWSLKYANNPLQKQQFDEPPPPRVVATTAALHMTTPDGAGSKEQPSGEANSDFVGVDGPPAIAPPPKRFVISNSASSTTSRPLHSNERASGQLEPPTPSTTPTRVATAATTQAEEREAGDIDEPTSATTPTPTYSPPRAIGRSAIDDRANAAPWRPSSSE